LGRFWRRKGEYSPGIAQGKGRGYIYEKIAKAGYKINNDLA